MGQVRLAPVRRLIAGWLCAGATVGCVAGFLTVLQMKADTSRCQ